MSRYGKIETGFWHNPKVRQLSEQGRFMLLYLLSCPHSNAAGCFVLPDGYIAADLGWSLETVSQTLSELFEKGLIERDAASNLTRIIGWWGHNAIENANVAKHVAKEISSLPNCEVRQRLIDDLLARTDLHETVRQTLSERLGKPFRNQEPNPTQQEPKSRRVAKATPPTDEKFEEFWSEYPKRKGDNPKAPARKQFDAAVRQGADPDSIVAGVKAACARNRDKIGTEYIPQAVKWLRDRRWEDYQSDQSERPPSIDWRKRMDIWARSSPHDRTWFQAWGPAPDQAGCEVPRELLIEFGAVAHETTPKTEAA